MEPEETEQRTLSNGTGQGKKRLERNETEEETLRNGTEQPVRSTSVQRPFRRGSTAVHVQFSLNRHPIARIEKGIFL